MGGGEGSFKVVVGGWVGVRVLSHDSFDRREGGRKVVATL